MNGYIAFYNGKRVEIRAASLYAAKLEAVRVLNVPKSKQGLLAVELAEKDGETVALLAYQYAVSKGIIHQIRRGESYVKA